MANVRINSLAGTATTVASDDYLAVDGTTNGTRKKLANSLVTLTDTQTLTNKTLTDAVAVVPNADMGALSVDTAKRANTKTVAADSTLTFSSTPTAGTIFGVVITNSDSASHVITVPSSYSLSLGATSTSFTLGASAVAEITWRYDGTTYFMEGEPRTIAELSSVTPASGDKVALHDISAGVDGYATISSILGVGTGQKDVWLIPIGDETTAITTGTAKVTFRAPYAATVTAVRASLTTASSSGTPTFDINEGGTTIISTKLTIDANEKTSTTAATPAVISDSSIADDAEITIDVDTAGTGAAGAKIQIHVTRA
jgi:hypothetical protein